MTPGRIQEGSLRPGRFELSRLGWALLISLVLHLGGYGGYKLGERFNFWERFQLPAWLRKTEIARTPEDKPKEMPLMFVDVNPQLAEKEPPKDAKYFSDKNSQAANPEMDKETGQPKINGQQTDIVKAEDVQRLEMDRALPSIPRSDHEQEPESAKPKAPTTPGDLAMAKPDDILRPGTGTAEQSRPRTLKEVERRQNRNQLVGQKMKQEGGVGRMRVVPGFDVKDTPFGDYMATFVVIVEQRWFDLLDSHAYAYDRHGRVLVEFRLNHDGQITNMKVLESNVGEMWSLVCQQAVLQPAPYDRWPKAMREELDKDYRDIKFAFYY